MPFAHAQATAYTENFTVGTTSISMVLTNPPAPGDLVIVGALAFNTGSNPAITSVIDNNSNKYIPTRSTPFAQSTGTPASLYYLIAPSNAGKTVTVTINPALATGGALAAYLDDFTVTGGRVGYDQDLGATSAGTTSPTNVPTITPNFSGSLLYAFGNASNTFTGVSGAWTQNTIGVGPSAGDDAAWILSASGSQTPSFTFAPTMAYGILVGAFYIYSNYTVEEYGQVITFGRSI